MTTEDLLEQQKIGQYRRMALLSLIKLKVKSLNLIVMFHNDLLMLQKL